MRDPKRIDRIINLLKSVWLTYPDLRLSQVIDLGSIGDIKILDCDRKSRIDNYYMEDEVFEENLKKRMKKLKEKN